MNDSMTLRQLLYCELSHPKTGEIKTDIANALKTALKPTPTMPESLSLPLPPSPRFETAEVVCEE